MEHRTLGRSGLQVSVVGLGCNNFGGRCDMAQTRAVVRRALDLGVTLFDTADVYGNRGLSEEYLGKALEGRRSDVVVATKFGFPMGDAPQMRGASRRYVCEAVEASLRRLGSDYIDLYQIHLPDPRTPIEETLRALDDLVRQGKVRYVGCSNFAAWQLVEAHWTAKALNLTSFVSAQNLYNLLDRRIERELVPAADRCGVGLLPYFPLANGLLTGKYRRDQQPPEGTRLAGLDEERRRGLLSRLNFETLDELETLARQRGRTLVELAVGWLAAQPLVASVIAGATKPEQVDQNVRAADWKPTPEDLAAIDEATRRRTRAQA
jgi:aryl-alcohol dehydrogenase-like predicted oxidoreductase